MSENLVHDAVADKLFEKLLEVGDFLGESPETFEQLNQEYFLVNKDFVVQVNKKGISKVPSEQIPGEIQEFILENRMLNY